MKYFYKGFNFCQDGPGNRLVYHLQGCNLRCIWCSNPEGMPIEGGKEASVKEILRECISCKPMFFSGGGVTFTGGEATLQYLELLELFPLLRAENINTAIETNGTSPHLQMLIPHIDHLIMDFKHFDSDIHKKFTALGNESVKKNFEYICKNGIKAHIRIPLIGGFNADMPEGFAEYFSSLDTKNVTFEFLKYHEYGKEKWTTEYKVKNGFVTSEQVDRFKKIFADHDLKLIET